MANRNFNRKQALEKEVKELHADVAVGASGAPTLTKGMGIASITRNSAGLYTMVLQDNYVRLMGMEVMQVAASAQALAFQIAAEDVDGAKTIQFRCMDSSAAATDPSNGSRLLIRLELKNSSI